MRLVCPKCNARYNIADELVAGRNFRVSCKECGTAIRSGPGASVPPAKVVRESAPPAEPDGVQTVRTGEPPAVAVAEPPKPPVPDNVPNTGADVWFLLQDGERLGPFSAKEIGDRLDSGESSWGTDVWRGGMRDWKPARRDALLVTAVASARGKGRVGDTLKLEANTSFLPGDDTVVDRIPDEQQLAANQPSSGTMRVDSTSDTKLLDGQHWSQPVARAAGAAAGVDAVADPGLQEKPSAWRSPQNQAFRSALGMPPDSSRIDMEPDSPPPTAVPGQQPGTLAAAFRSAPSLMASGQANAQHEPVTQTPSWNPIPPKFRSGAAVAVLSFLGGILVTAIWARVSSSDQTAPTVVIEPTPTAAPSAGRPAAAAVATTAKRSPGAKRAKPVVAFVAEPDDRPMPRQTLLEPEPLRELPQSDEIRAAVKLVTPDVRRCLANPRKGVDLAIHIDGPSGRVREVKIRRPSLPPGRAQCVRHAVRQIQIAPFARPDLRLLHKFAWRT